LVRDGEERGLRRRHHHRFACARAAVGARNATAGV